LNGECGLIIDFCVVCAKIMSFVYVLFFYLFCCDINKASRDITHRRMKKWYKYNIFLFKIGIRLENHAKRHMETAEIRQAV
jgi:hypothetical protein